MKKFIIFVGLIFVVVIGYLFMRGKNGPTEIISFRASGVPGATGGSGWRGEAYGPSIWKIDYHDLNHISSAFFDSSLLSRIGTELNELVEFPQRNKDAVVYVRLKAATDGNWFVPDLVTENMEKLKGQSYLKGKLNGSGMGKPVRYGEKNVWAIAGVSYDGIESSEFLVPFTDFYGIAARNSGISIKNDDLARVEIDDAGRALLKEVLIGGKTCIEKWHVNFDDKDCWRDYREQAQSQKKYSLSFGPLLIRYITRLFH